MTKFMMGLESQRNLSNYPIVHLPACEKQVYGPHAACGLHIPLAIYHLLQTLTEILWTGWRALFSRRFEWVRPWRDSVEMNLYFCVFGVLSFSSAYNFTRECFCVKGFCVHAYWWERRSPVPEAAVFTSRRTIVNVPKFLNEILTKWSRFIVV